jgi:hypothetical protein
MGWDIQIMKGMGPRLKWDRTSDAFITSLYEACPARVESEGVHPRASTLAVCGVWILSPKLCRESARVWVAITETPGAHT